MSTRNLVLASLLLLTAGSMYCRGRDHDSPGIPPPLDVTNLEAVPGDSRVELRWTPSGEANVEQYGVTVTDTRDGAVAQWRFVTPGSATGTTFTLLGNGIAYRFTVVTYVQDPSLGQRASTGVSVTASPIGPADTQRPTDVFNLVAIPGYNGAQVWLSWAAPTDNVGVVSQTLTVSTPPPPAPDWGNGATVVQVLPLMAVTTGTGVNGLIPGLTYRFRILAKDPTGNESPGGATAFVDVALRDPGQLVGTFGTSGVVTSNPSSRDDGARFLVVEGNTLLLGGYDESPAAGDYQWRVEARDATSGALVASFGSAGVVVSNPSPGVDAGIAGVTSGGDLYMVGLDESPGVGDIQWRIERRSASTGALVAGFGTGGVVTSNPSSGDDEPRGCVTDGTHLYIAGWDASPGGADWQWRVEKRLLSTGALDPSFASGGVLTVNPSARTDGIMAVANDSTALYLVGVDEAPATWDYRWRVEKRSLATGAPVTAFGSTGVVTVNPGGGQDAAWRVALDGGFLFVGGYEEVGTGGDFRWRVEKRGTASGTRDTGFGTDGVLTVNPSAGDDTVTGVLVSGLALYLVGWDSAVSASTWQWRVEKRWASTGAYDTQFGSGGVVRSNPTPGLAAPNGVTLSGGQLYVFGDDEPSDSNWRWRVEVRWP